MCKEYELVVYFNLKILVHLRVCFSAFLCPLFVVWVLFKSLYYCIAFICFVLLILLCALYLFVFMSLTNSHFSYIHRTTITTTLVCVNLRLFIIYTHAHVPRFTKRLDFYSQVFVSNVVVVVNLISYIKFRLFHFSIFFMIVFLQTINNFCWRKFI